MAEVCSTTSISTRAALTAPRLSGQVSGGRAMTETALDLAPRGLRPGPCIQSATRPQSRGTCSLGRPLVCTAPPTKLGQLLVPSTAWLCPSSHPTGREREVGVCKARWVRPGLPHSCPADTRGHSHPVGHQHPTHLALPIPPTPSKQFRFSLNSGTPHFPPPVFCNQTKT